MTKANDAARSRVADAERRARRKIKRLQNKGVRTGSITPFKDVDPSNTRALNSYHKQLEQFISRETRFVAGQDGTPIPYSTYRDFKRLERQWNKEHDKYWRKFADKPFLTAYGASDTTLGMRSQMTKIKGLQYKGIDYVRDTPASALKGVPDIKRRTDILKRELSPTYQKKRIQQLRKNLMANAESFNDARIPKAIRKLTNEQLFALQNFTNFVPLYYRYMSTNVTITLGEDIDATEHDAQVEHMLMLIEQVKSNYPAAVKEWQTKGRKTKKGRKHVKSKAKIKVYAPTKEAAKQRARELYSDFYGG